MDEWRRISKEENRDWAKYTSKETRLWVSKSLGSKVVVDYKVGAITAISSAKSSREAEIKVKKHLFKILLESDTWDLLDINGKRADSIEYALVYVGTKDVGISKERNEYKAETILYLTGDHLQLRKERYRPFITKYANEAGLDVSLIEAIIEIESHYNPMAVSKKNAIGLMQLIPDQAGADAFKIVTGEVGEPTVQQLFDPEYNIKLGVTYLKHLYDRFHYVVDAKARSMLVLISYNWGIGNVTKHMKPHADIKYNDIQNRMAVVPKETKNYLSTLMNLTYIW